MLLNNQWITKEIKKNPRDKWKQKHYDPESTVLSKSIFKREVYSNTSLPQETRKISTKQPNFTPKGTRKRTTTKKKQHQS